LKGQILSSQHVEEKYHIIEKYHTFVLYKDKYYRFNEIWREESVKGRIQQSEKITTNFAPVMYEVDLNYFKRNGYQVWQIAN
jgi:hypothetical protein